MSSITWKQYQEIRDKMILDFLKNAIPKDRHRLVLGWNWDGESGILKWIANDPDTDKATALMLYWKSCPRPVKQYANRDEASSNNSADDFDFIENIEKLFLSGFYKNQQIAFDPTNDRGTNWTTEYLDMSIKREIPNEMFKKLSGENVESGHDEGWEEGIPPHIWKKMREYKLSD